MRYPLPAEHVFRQTAGVEETLGAGVEEAGVTEIAEPDEAI
jgi:hypothetical protein